LPQLFHQLQDFVGATRNEVFDVIFLCNTVSGGYLFTCLSALHEKMKTPTNSDVDKAPSKVDSIVNLMMLFLGFAVAILMLNSLR